MPPGIGRVNRGPAAAAENHQAILASARRLFTERGFNIPMSVIAKDAGVSQGVLYRHFPTKFDLAFTVFEDHFARLEQVLAEPEPEPFQRFWNLLTELMVEGAAFVEMVVTARRDGPEYDGEERLRSLVERALDAGHADGSVDTGVSADTTLLAWRMCFGVVVTAPDPAPAALHAAVLEARTLLPSAFR